MAFALEMVHNHPQRAIVQMPSHIPPRVRLGTTIATLKDRSACGLIFKYGNGLCEPAPSQSWLWIGTGPKRDFGIYCGVAQFPPWHPCLGHVRMHLIIREQAASLVFP
jgi:hypothetical protein